MPLPKLTAEDQEWLSDHAPDLSIGEEDGIPVISGILSFDMDFQGEEKPYIIDPGPEHVAGGERIQDEYQIKIMMTESDNSTLPRLRETGGRIEKVARETDRALEDLHMNGKDGTVCLCVWTEETEYLPEGFNLPHYFYRLVIPFFFAQSYFEKHGEWPWGTYSHGKLGLLEWYSAQENSTREDTEDLIVRLRQVDDWEQIEAHLRSKRGVKGHQPCLCGSPANLASRGEGLGMRSSGPR